MASDLPRSNCRVVGGRLAAMACALLIGCAAAPPQPPPSAAEDSSDVAEKESISSAETDLIQRTDSARIEALERQVERLRTDLARAEDALVAVESRLETSYSRANAVSSLAEAQMQLNKVSEIAPWQSQEIERAREKLAIAQRHIDNEYFGAAMFFVYRANRIVEELRQEARIVETTPQAMFINRPRVNLRAGPSTDDEIITVLTRGTPVIRGTRQDKWVLVRTLTGLVGWVHGELLTSKERFEL